MLRAATRQKFIEALETSYFTAANYRLEFDDGSPDILTIMFLARPEFQFVLRRGGNAFLTEESPGEHFLTSERFPREDLDECLYAVSQWTERILDGYKRRNPIVDEFEEFRRRLEERLQDAGEASDAAFSQSELAELRAKLDDLNSRLDDLSDKTTGITMRLADAHAEIEKLKSQAEQVPRGVWYRMANNKIVAILKSVATSKETREFALEAAKKYFLEGPK